MKKKYQKPEIAVENFVLSDYISSCNLPEVNPSSGTCKLESWVENNNDLENLWYANYFIKDCEQYDPDEIYANSGYCYQTPNGVNVIVSS